MSQQRVFSFKNLLHSAASNWLGFSANLVVVLLTTPFVVHKLGDASYGIWVLALQVTGYMGVFDAGVRSAVVRFVAKNVAAHDDNGVNDSISAAFVTHLGIGVLAVLFSVAVALWGAPYMHVAPVMLLQARYTILLAGLTIAISFPLGVFGASLSGLGRFPEINVISIAFLVLRTLLIVGFLAKGYGLVTLAIIQLICTVLSGVASTFYLRYLLPFLRISWSLRNRELLWQMLSHTVYAFILSVANRLNYEVDSLVIVAFLPIEQVTYYVLGFRLVTYIRDFANATTQIVMPATSSISGSNSASRMELVVIKGSLYVLSLMYPIVVAVLFCGGDFLRLWVGPSYAERATPVLLVFAASQFISLTQYIPGHMLFGLSQHRLNVWCTAVEAILNVGLSIMFVRRYGITGVALGTAISVSLVRGIVFPLCFAKTLHTKAGAFLWRAVAPTIIPTVAMALVLHEVRRVILPVGYFHLLLPIMAAAGMYTVLVWLLAFDAGDRERFRALLRRQRLEVAADAGSIG